MPGYYWTDKAIAEFKRIVRKVDNIRGPGVRNEPESVVINLPQADPRDTPMPRPVRLKIDSARTKGSAYKAYIFKPPAAGTVDFNASGAITEADYGQQGEEVVAINQAEVTHDTHDLTGGTPYSKFVWAIPSPIRSSDGKRVFEVFAIDTKDCT